MINFRFSAKGYVLDFNEEWPMIYFDVKQRQIWKEKNKYPETIP